MAIILDGKALAKKVRRHVASEVATLPRQPGLSVILVGDDPASRLYVSNKEKDCVQCGIRGTVHRLPGDATQAEVLSLIDRLNRDPETDGIIVQLPLPPQIDPQAVIWAIAPEKDVDCLHPANIGRAFSGQPIVWPCTPFGVMELLREYGISPKGKKCVVIGRSNLVGKPMALLLLREGGTVTVCHSQTADLSAETRTADLLISAAGKRGLISAEQIKPGAVVVDISINPKEGGGFCGDVDFDAAEQIASYLTPVPGGVGPMTRAALMQNVLAAAKARLHCGKA